MTDISNPVDELGLDFLGPREGDSGDGQSHLGSSLGPAGATDASTAATGASTTATGAEFLRCASNSRRFDAFEVASSLRLASYS